MKQLAVATLLWSATALADEATEAKLRFDRGLSLYDRGKTREALDEFFVSHRLAPNPSAAFNIATCLDTLERFDEAYAAYSDYLSGELSPEERAQGEAALARILKKVARLRVLTTPEGAALYLDRKNLGQYGKTPRSLAAPEGKHKVILTLPEHHDAEREVVLSKGAELVLEVAMKPLDGVVRISSEPSAAMVTLVDGIKLGETPLEKPLPRGAHRMTISKSGFEPKTIEVEVRGAETASANVELAPLPPPRGRVRILSNISSALVSVDGEEAGFSPVVLELVAGEHQLLVHQPGYRPYAGKLTVQKDRVLAIEVTLEPEQQATGRGPWPWVLLTTSAASGVVGLGLGARALGLAGEYEDAPTRELYERARSLNVAADVMFGIALLGGAATGALFFFGEDVEERESSAKEELR